MNRFLPNNDNVDRNVHSNDSNNYRTHESAYVKIWLVLIEAHEVVKDEHNHDFIEEVHLVCSRLLKRMKLAHDNYRQNARINKPSQLIKEHIFADNDQNSQYKSSEQKEELVWN